MPSPKDCHGGFDSASADGALLQRRGALDTKVKVSARHQQHTARSIEADATQTRVLGALVGRRRLASNAHVDAHGSARHAAGQLAECVEQRRLELGRRQLQRRAALFVLLVQRSATQDQRAPDLEALHSARPMQRRVSILHRERSQ